MAGRSAEHVLRSLARSVVVALARLVFGAPDRGALPPLRKILVVRTDERVGNVLLTIPLLRALRTALPEAEIDLLHAASKRALIEGLPYPTRSIPFDRQDAFRAPLRLMRLLRELRARRYDVAIEAGHWHAFSLTAALLCRVVKARTQVGHDRGDARALLGHVVPAPTDVTHDVTVKLRLLGPLGLPGAGLALETPLGADAASTARAAAQLSEIGLVEGRFLLVNPGSRKLDRRWPADRYGRAAAAAGAAHGLTPVILWGPGEESIARAVVEAAGPTARLAPRTNLRELAALFRRAALVLTNDTGPMHLAAACGAPVVAVFVVADHERWGHPFATFSSVPLAALEGDEAREQAAVAAAVARVLGASAPAREGPPVD